MRTFYIATLGCKVNQYESEQLATLLRSHGLVPAATEHDADLRVINTCSVTIQAASKSRQATRHASRQTGRNAARDTTRPIQAARSIQLPQLHTPHACATDHQPPAVSAPLGDPAAAPVRVVVTGCWATSDTNAARQLPGVSAVITHHDDVAARLRQLLTQWQSQEQNPPVLHTHLPSDNAISVNRTSEQMPEPLEDDGWIIQAGSLAPQFTASNKSQPHQAVKKKSDGIVEFPSTSAPAPGTAALPLLDGRQDAHQRAFLKIQDGCDAHCTYCIIPSLRPRLWSKDIDDAVEEAQRMVRAGHREIVLTGIFLGAYGQPTALRRRQSSAASTPLAHLVEALCTRVPGLLRLRLSSLEPGDLTPGLISTLRSFPQVVPHFHLPLQSGSDAILRKMNRQYTRADFFEMIDRVRDAFDRPALTTDVIAGFPAETDEEFQRTIEAADYARFIHIHAFHFSPRPGTAAARWGPQFIRGPVVQDRVAHLTQLAARHDHAFRQQFLGETVQVLVERPAADAPPALQHGRSGHYFPVHFESPESLTGRAVQIRIDRVTPGRTHGTLIRIEESPGKRPEENAA